MLYEVKYTSKALKNLKKMDRSISGMIVAWIRKNLEMCEDPRAKGERLSANHSGKWKYRIGEYRILAQIQDEQLIILVIEVGHRKEIYLQK